METGRSTTPSSASCAKADCGTLPSLAFDLPENVEVHPLCSIEQMIQRSRELRRWFPADLPTEEERWRAKTTDEFRLQAPSPAQ
jgi:hypothetical protein